MTPTPAGPAPKSSSLLYIVIGVLGLMTCAGGGCLVLGAFALAADDSSAEATPAQPATPSEEAASGENNVWCNATGWVRVCGMGGSCSSLLMSGTGIGKDEFSASQMALTACRGNIIARGGTGTCSVACSRK